MGLESSLLETGAGRDLAELTAEFHNIVDILACLALRKMVGRGNSANISSIDLANALIAASEAVKSIIPSLVPEEYVKNHLSMIGGIPKFKIICIKFKRASRNS